MSPVEVVTRADDAGSCVSANEAVRVSVEGGLVRNVSVIVPGPSFEALAPWLKEVEGVDVGIHLTMNAEWDRVKWGPCAPLDQVRSLIDQDGLFLPTTAALKDRSGLAEATVVEARAQVERARSLGVKPVYMDDHMGFTWLPGVRDALTALGRELGLQPRFGGFKRWPEVPPVSAEDPDALVDSFLARVANAEGGVYLWVTHPGFDRDDMRVFGHAGHAPGQIAREREADRLFWLSPKLKQAVADGRFAVRRYSQIGS